MKIEVSRGSQFQKEPQLNFAQIDPVTVASAQNMSPRPAEAADFMSSSRFLFLRYLMPYQSDTMNATTVVQAMGTWKKRIRARCSRPGITGNSYHCTGVGTIGNTNATTIMTVIQMLRKIFNACMRLLTKTSCFKIQKKPESG